MDYTENKIRIAGIIKESIVDGPGIRFVIFSQGCHHNCKGCQNPETHDITGGYLCDMDKILGEISKNPLLAGVTISGGEPFLQARAFAEIGKKIKTLKTVEKRLIREDGTRRIVKEEIPMKLNLFAFTGFTLEKLTDMARDDIYIYTLLDMLDGLIDGPFILKERDLTLKFRGSKNQRILERESIQKALQSNILR